MSQDPERDVQGWLLCREDGGRTGTDWLLSMITEGFDQTRLSRYQLTKDGEFRGGADSSWQWEMAMSMVPYFPEIVTAAEETDKGLEITFDWAAVLRCVLSAAPQPAASEDEQE